MARCGATGTRLVLVGDPKQAVYAFRGADVHAYLDAVRAAGPRHHFTLEENWRSDAALLAAYDALFDPLHLGHPEIIYRRVQATPPHYRPGLRGAPSPAPLRARLVPRDDRRLVRTGERLVQKGSALRWIADDLAGDVVLLLGSGAELVAWDADRRRRDHVAHIAQRHRGAGADQPPGRSRPGMPCGGAGCPWSWRVPRACSPPRRRVTGCGCSRRSNSRRLGRGLPPPL